MAQAGQLITHAEELGSGASYTDLGDTKSLFYLCQVLACFCICEEVEAKDLVPKLGTPHPRPGPGIMVGPGEHLINAYYYGFS